MRIRIDIDISATEFTAWLESIVAAPAPVAAAVSPTVDGEDWDTDWDFPSDDEFLGLDDPFDAPMAEDTLAAESNAIAAATRWMASRVKGGDHA